MLKTYTFDSVELFSTNLSDSVNGGFSSERCCTLSVEQGFHMGMMVPFCPYAWTVIVGKSKPYLWLSSVLKKKAKFSYWHSPPPHPMCMIWLRVWSLLWYNRLIFVKLSAGHAVYMLSLGFPIASLENTWVYSAKYFKNHPTCLLRYVRYHVFESLLMGGLWKCCR